MLQFFRAGTADSCSSVVEACAISRSLARISSLCTTTPWAVLDTHRSQACSWWKLQSNTLQSKIKRITVFNIGRLQSTKSKLITSTKDVWTGILAQNRTFAILLIELTTPFVIIIKTPAISRQYNLIFCVTQLNTEFTATPLLTPNYETTSISWHNSFQRRVVAFKMTNNSLQKKKMEICFIKVAVDLSWTVCYCIPTKEI